eukprot:scaffold89447_cov59-Phaeocystis_antarctica.AAC.4
MPHGATGETRGEVRRRREGKGRETLTAAASLQLLRHVSHTAQRDAQSVRSALGLEVGVRVRVKVRGRRLLLRTLAPNDGPDSIGEALGTAARREHA